MNDVKGPVDLKARTRNFALRVIGLYSALPKTTEAQVIGKQVLRLGTSVGCIIVRHLALVRRLSLLARLRVAFRNSKKRCIGWNCWWRQGL